MEGKMIINIVLIYIPIVRIRIVVHILLFEIEMR
jgi:hypothetical protein